MMIKGITIQLEVRSAGTADAFNRTAHTSTWANVENVLVYPMSEQEITETLNLTGKKCVYQLAIPKGDTNVWTDCRVQFFGKTFHVVGEPIKGITVSGASYGGYSDLATAVAAISERLDNLVIVLDSGELVGGIGSKLDAHLGVTENLALRGVV